jgi:hypothetical protein
MSKGWIVFISIVVLVILALGFFGLFPGVSTLLGANKPKDLGVKYTQADLDAGRAMTGVSLQEQPTVKSLTFDGSKSISGEYSDQTITAMINGAKYKYYPLSNTQLRINPDGTVEASGVINISKVGQWSLDLGAQEGLVAKAKSYIGIVSPSPSFYLKGAMSVTNNQISLNLTEAKVSRFTAPKSIIDQYQGPLADFVEERMANVPGLQVRSAKFESGKLLLDANYPAVEKSAR